MMKKAMNLKLDRSSPSLKRPALLPWRLGATVTSVLLSLNSIGKKTPKKLDCVEEKTIKIMN